MKPKYLRPIVLGAAMVAALGACGSSSGHASSIYTIGVFTDATGPASQNGTSVKGVQAGLAQASKEGLHFKMVVDDTQTTPAGALAAAKSMVTQQHVSVVLAYSSLTFAAASYLTSHNVPVVGVNIDGTEWIKAPNMFSTFGYVDSTKVSNVAGRFLKMQGATRVGTLGYAISPSSADAAKAEALSAKAAGLAVPYNNPNFPFGSTNVQPVALAMKNAGVNAVFASTEPGTSLALLTALRQLGVNVKVASFPDGYGGDLTSAGPGAQQAAQGVYFTTSLEPIEMHTAATKQFVTDLKSAGVNSDPTIAEYSAYSSMAAIAQAFKSAPAHPTSAQLIKALDNETNFNAWGLLGSHPFNLGVKNNTPTGPDGCGYVTQWKGSSFHLVPGADPICGALLPGVTVG